MSRKFLILCVVTILLAGATYFAGQAQDVVRTEPLVIQSKDGATHRFDIEIADTPIAQEVGLMFRDHMDPDHGMLFELGRSGVVRFWMKNTLIPLDMLFIAANGEIKTIHANATPKSLASISSEVPVSAVLELNGGRVASLGIKTGDRVVHAYFKSN